MPEEQTAVIDPKPFERLAELEKDRPRNYRIFRLYLDTARTNKRYVFPGNYFYIEDASDKDANIEVRFDKDDADQIKMQKHRGARTAFREFYVTHGAQAGKTVDIAIATESANFSLIDTGLVELTSAVSIGGAAGTPSPSIVSVTDASILLVAANASRRTVLIQNHGANPLYVTTTNPAVAAASPIILLQYQAMTMDTTAAIYGIRGVAGAQNVGVFEEVNS